MEWRPIFTIQPPKLSSLLDYKLPDLQEYSHDSFRELVKEFKIQDLPNRDSSDIFLDKLQFPLSIEDVSALVENTTVSEKLMVFIIKSLINNE